MLLALGELKAGSQKSGKKDCSVIDFYESWRTVAGKVSWAGGLRLIWGDDKMPEPQPAYPMEEPANIFGERLQLPQRHDFGPAQLSSKVIPGPGERKLSSAK